MSIDAVEEAIVGCGLAQSWEGGVAACEAARVAAEPNLQLGHDLVVDAVNDSDPARHTWRVPDRGGISVQHLTSRPEAKRLVSHVVVEVSVGGSSLGP